PPAARGARPRADALHRFLEVGNDARNAFAPRPLLGAERRPRGVLRGSHRPGLRAREPGERAWLPPRLPRRAVDRRPLLGALAFRDRPRRAARDRPRAVLRAD